MEDKDKEQYFQGNPDIPMRETEYTEERNELALSEDEIDAGLGKGVFERHTSAEEQGHTDPAHPNYRPQGIPRDR